VSGDWDAALAELKRDLNRNEDGLFTPAGYR